jgi:hypothetical protein
MIRVLTRLARMRVVAVESVWSRNALQVAGLRTANYKPFYLGVGKTALNKRCEIKGCVVDRRNLLSRKAVFVYMLFPATTRVRAKRVAVRNSEPHTRENLITARIFAWARLHFFGADCGALRAPIRTPLNANWCVGRAHVRGQNGCVPAHIGGAEMCSSRAWNGTPWVIGERALSATIAHAHCPNETRAGCSESA